MAYSNLQCTSCRGNYATNLNAHRLYEYDFSKPLVTPKSVIELLFNIKINIPFDKSNIVCALGDIDNCTEYNDYRSCKTCATGYYLSNSTKSCISMPTFITDNCQVFALSSNILECSTCRSGYKLTSKTCTVLDSYIQGCN